MAAAKLDATTASVGDAFMGSVCMKLLLRVASGPAGRSGGPATPTWNRLSSRSPPSRAPRSIPTPRAHSHCATPTPRADCSPRSGLDEQSAATQARNSDREDPVAPNPARVELKF
eukprot:scaffold52_cov246-Pinguiococcus_pyrenoidosus.AAC.4